MYVISRRIIYPSVINDQPVKDIKPHEYIFDFKRETPNERTLLPGRDYWAKGWLFTQNSVARKQNLGCEYSEGLVKVYSSGGTITIYKVEGEFEEWQIDKINAALKLGFTIESVYEQIEKLGWESFI